MPLPPLPSIVLELLEELPSAQGQGFLRLVRRRYRAHYADGTASSPFLYDAVHRDALDAVVMAAYFSVGHTRHVYLRSALRPPLLLRKAHPVPDPVEGMLWELPAGLVDPAERDTLVGVQGAAQRELEEELGFRVPIDRLERLGISVFPVPGCIAERHFFFAVEVDPTEQGEPLLDGSALERDGVVHALPLGEALDLCQTGAIQDAKTELGLRRLVEHRP